MKIAKYDENWNETLALWSGPGPGHTPETYDLPLLHVGRVAAWRLVEAGLDDMLDKIAVERVLHALSAMQERTGARPGGFRWYWEEKRIHDTNAAFFTTLALVLLELEFGTALPLAARTVLRDMLKLAQGWFSTELAGLERSLCYPNKTLGDLVCAWLLAEVNGDHTPELVAHMTRAADYYRDENWGWGEHMSDGYALVCQYELTALLIYGRSLPPAARQAYEALLAALNSIDARFVGGPRVPAIRSYNFQVPPCIKNGVLTPRATFVDDLAAWPADGIPGGFTPLRGLAARHNFAARHCLDVARQERFATPCFDGAQAFSVVKDEWRMGVMSRYPIMPNTEYPSWGLCWQSMPLCYWNAQGAWGFAQWEATRNGVTRAHPANEGHHRGMVQLSGDLEPAVVGQTLGAMIDDQCFARRVINPAGAGFARVADRFRLLNSNFGQVEESRLGEWRALTLRNAGHTLRILCHTQVHVRAPQLKHREAGGLDWEVVAETPDQPLETLWLWQAGSELAPPPQPREAMDVIGYRRAAAGHGNR